MDCAVRANPAWSPPPLPLVHSVVLTRLTPEALQGIHSGPFSRLLLPARQGVVQYCTMYDEVRGTHSHTHSHTQGKYSLHHCRFSYIRIHRFVYALCLRCVSLHVWLLKWLSCPYASLQYIHRYPSSIYPSSPGPVGELASQHRVAVLPMFKCSPSLLHLLQDLLGGGPPRRVPIDHHVLSLPQWLDHLFFNQLSHLSHLRAQAVEEHPGVL